MQQAKPTKPGTSKYGSVVIASEIAKADRCICSELGPYIDIKWKTQTAQMQLSKSQSPHFEYQNSQEYETFRCVPFFHDKDCQLEDQTIAKNSESTVVPCAVVLIKNNETHRILATQRHQRMSFGNLWVLPGGHLQKGQTIIEGGLRQCQQEVGLKAGFYKLNKNPQVMAWQSVLMNQANTKIKRVALIIFFSVESEHFEVNQQKSEVKRWEWRQFENGERPWGGGWAEGHLRYLEHLFQLKKNSQK